MIELKLHNKASLMLWLNQPEYKQLPVLPISIHRGISQCNNPAALPEDVLLVTAWFETKLVGYVGILPDDWHTPDQTFHIGWLSCIWVDDAIRGQGIAKKLVLEALRVWKDRIVLTEFTEPARMLYQKLNRFDRLPDKKGIRIYYRLDSQKYLPAKKAFLTPFKPMFSIADRLVNTIVDAYRGKPKKRFNFEEVFQMDEESMDFIQQYSSLNQFRNSLNAFNWMLQQPWLVKGDVSDELAKKYAFSSVASQVRQSLFKIKNAQGEMKALLWVMQRDQDLKIPYYWQAPDATADEIGVLDHIAQEWGIKTITLYHPKLIDAIHANGFPSLLIRSFTRSFMISKVLNNPSKVLVFNPQDGDGDCGFT